MAVETRPTTRQGAETVFVDRFCDGVIGPSCQQLGPVRDGGHIVANTAPGCWGPMITPAIKGGHEVTLPVAVEGAEIGDAIAIRIRDISVTSIATSSGNDRTIEGRFNGDPYCAKVCASWDTWRGKASSLSIDMQTANPIASVSLRPHWCASRWM